MGEPERPRFFWWKTRKSAPEPAMAPEPFPLVGPTPEPFPPTGLVDEQLARQSWQPLEPVNEAEREEREAEFRIKQARWKAQRTEAEAVKERVKPMAQVMRDLEPISGNAGNANS